MRSLIEPLARRQGISLIRLRRLLPNSRQSGSYRLESKGRVRRLLRIALYTASDRPIKPTCPEWLLRERIESFLCHAGLWKYERARNVCVGPMARVPKVDPPGNLGTKVYVSIVRYGSSTETRTFLRTGHGASRSLRRGLE